MVVIIRYVISNSSSNHGLGCLYFNWKGKSINSSVLPTPSAMGE